MATDPLSLTLAALADPTRRGILARLSRGDATVGELAQPFDLRLPTISKHLKVLERAGLVRKERRAQWRRCRLDPQPLRELDRWIQDYSRLWEERHERLDRYLRGADQAVKEDQGE